MYKLFTNNVYFTFLNYTVLLQQKQIYYVFFNFYLPYSIVMQRKPNDMMFHLFICYLLLLLHLLVEKTRRQGYNYSTTTRVADEFVKECERTQNSDAYTQTVVH